MDQKLVEFNQKVVKKEIACPLVGDIVRVHKKIKEGNKERIQIFKGLVIAVKGRQSSSPMITVRRESDGVGTEIVFPLYLPTIEKIEVLRHSTVRRSKLYYMRGRSGKRAKMKIQELTLEEKAGVKKTVKEEAAVEPEKKEIEADDKKTDNKEPEKKEAAEEKKAN